MSKWGIAAVYGFVFVWVSGCGSVAQPERLVRVEEAPRGTSCLLGGTVIFTGHDTNQDGLLADEEVEETRYACQQPGQRSRLVPEPEGTHCPYGGTALLTGLDTNGNDVLDPAEVTNTEYLCHDADPQALLRIEEEAPGANCPVGGRRILNGLDRDDDGVLDDGEVLSTRYVCETRELVRVDAGQAGSHCPGDGAAVRSGTDTNGDGILQDSEVTKTEYVCDRVIIGDVTINSQLELLALEDVAVITGNLDISYTHGIVNVDLPALKHLGGELALYYLPELRNVSLPALERVGGSIRIDRSPNLDRVDLGSLRDVPGQLHVSDNSELVAMKLSSLEIVRGSIRVEKNPKLTVFGLPRLRWVDELSLWNVAASRIELPRLERVRSLFIVDGTATELHFPTLAYTWDDLVIARMPRLQRLELPVLYQVGRKFIVRDTQALASFSLPRLQEPVGEFDLWDNAGLSTFDAPELRSVDGWVHISNNDALTTLSGLRNVTSVGGLLFRGNAQLTSTEGLASLTRAVFYIQVWSSGFTNFRLPALRQAGTIIIGQTGQEGNEQLKSIQFPKLGMATALSLGGNPVLDMLELPILRFLSDALRIYSSPALPRCRVNALLEKLAAPPPEVELHDLDESPVCQSPAPAYRRDRSHIEGEGWSGGAEKGR